MKKLGLLLLVIALTIGLVFGSCTKPAETTGGTLKILTNEAPKNMGYPGAAADSGSYLIGRAAVENLVAMDPAGTGSIIPQLATGWSYSPDYSSLTFTLREGVKFHDGTPFNAAAAKLNLDLGLEAQLPTFKSITSIEVVDDNTIKLNLSSYDSTLLVSLSFDFTGKMLSPTAIENLGEEGAMLNPVGTGPFKFVSYEPNVSVKFEKFDDYWQEGKPYLDAVEWIVNADPVNSMMSFQAGEAHAIRSITTKDAADLRAMEKYKVLPAFDAAGSVTAGRGTLIGCVGVIGDSAHPDSPFSKIEVRRAISYAIDNAPLAEAVGFGSYPPLYQPFGETSPAHNPSVVGYPYNLQKAKDLMAQAGYGSGFDTNLYFPTFPPYADVYTIVQSALQEIGINVQLQPEDPGTFFDHMSSGWSNDLMCFIIPSPPGFDPGSALTGFLSNNAFMFDPNSVYIPPDYQAKLDQVVIEHDVQKRQALLQELSKMIIDEYCLVTPIFDLYLNAASSLDVQDFSLYDYAPHDWSPENVWLK